MQLSLPSLKPGHNKRIHLLLLVLRQSNDNHLLILLFGIVLLIHSLQKLLVIFYKFGDGHESCRCLHIRYFVNDGTLVNRCRLQIIADNLRSSNFDVEAFFRLAGVNA